jgi:hypothetical protein
MPRKYKRIAVNPDFARKLKAKASLAGQPLIEYTEHLARDTKINTMEEIKPKKQSTHRGFLDELGF